MLDMDENEILEAVRSAKADVDAARERYEAALEAAMDSRRLGGTLTANRVAEAGGLSPGRLYQVLAARRGEPYQRAVKG